MESSPSTHSLDQSVDDVDALGVINALERTCELEAKLRQAIQQTHPLTTTLDWDFSAADKEREALLAIRYARSHALMSCFRTLQFRSLPRPANSTPPFPFKLKTLALGHRHPRLAAVNIWSFSRTVCENTVS
jgi:hypothetical protein